MYGKPALKQMGAPLRLAVPWKYGFKSVKSIVRFSFTDQRPKTFWEGLQASEYGFWANVNPEVPHPRWSQATEEDITHEAAPADAAVQRLRRIRRRSLQGSGERASVGLTQRWNFGRRAQPREFHSCRLVDKEKTGPLRARLQSCRPRSTITFQRGTAGCIAIATWEEQRPGCLQRPTNYVPRCAVPTTQMTACQPCERRSHRGKPCRRAMIVCQKFHCCAFATRKSRNT